ncbi:cryptochrome [Aaosphaeria arxii CBS 175.79]|uniref:Cryptochrome DASH n=1 Tax=Aaosphaeria arxii CBS 175.79 TaxID=1450172 RepID=A0A6A5XV29_9PLEO|nr:cryptochrome [Aaosphaeria arxii CBS 175.79]KAF2017168.1 cryptochrome [Aaosphaeria arxii CBS 175.79]
MARRVTKPRILICILRRDVRLSDNPIFHHASQAFIDYDSHPETPDTNSREDSMISDTEVPDFTHLLPVYIFPANQVEVSGFLASDSKRSPYPEARSQIAGVWRTGPHRAKFMAEGAWNLKERLEGLECGSGLDLRVGMIGDVVENMLQWYAKEKDDDGNTAEVSAIWMTADDGTEERADERDVKGIAAHYGVNVRVWEDEKYFVDDRDLPLDMRSMSDLPNVYTTFRKSLEPLRECPRQILPAPTKLPPLPPHSPPQMGPFEIPNSLQALIERLLAPLNEDPSFGLSSPPQWPGNVESAHPFMGGESAAQDRLSHLIVSGAMSSYKATRNGMLGLDFSTKLSAYLAQGHLTARQVHWAMADFEGGNGEGRGVQGYGKGENEGTAAVRFELLWRDYMRLCARKFGSRMFHVDGIRDTTSSKRREGQDSYNSDQDQSSAKRWRYIHKDGKAGDDPAKTAEVFDRFRSGLTGIGLIDASNRELFLTGYTSNRARQNVASFLASHLGIDWRIGAEWYEFLLVDYDVGSNWGNWQYVAGVGNDPRQGRVFNPIKQALDYDPKGEYITAWVPELRKLQITKGIGPNKEEVDQQRLMGLFQAWRLEGSEKAQLGLQGLEWVEHPLVRIQFSVNRRRGQGNDGRGKDRGSWRGGRGKGKGNRRLGNEEKLGNSGHGDQM